MSSCIFCKIAAKEAPSRIEYEDEKFIAFDDINPIAPFHVLVIPKKHYEQNIDGGALDDGALVGELIQTARKIAKEKGLKGYKLHFNVGKEGGQLVEHLHLHLNNHNGV